MTNNSKNELTIKINFSDDLLSKVANMMLLSSAPTPLGVVLPQTIKSPNQAEKTPKSIGFKK